jgi:hypothetical protein
MNVCSSANRKAERLTEIKSLTLKIKVLSMESVVLNVNFRYPQLFDPKTEKLFVSVNGKDVEVKLDD